MHSSATLGTTEVQGLNHPCSSTEKHPLEGVPMGIILNSHAPLYLDPWYLKIMGYIHSTFLMVYGDKFAGKSAFIKMLMYRLSKTVRDGERFRIEVNDYKPEGKEGTEYAALAKKLRCRRFIMKDMRVNPFEPSLYTTGESLNKDFYQYGLLNMGKMLAEFDGLELSVMEFYANRIIMHYLVHNIREEFWSIDVLERLCSSVRKEAFDGYNQDVDDGLEKTIETRAQLINDHTVRALELQKIHALVSVPRNIQFEQLIPAFDSLAVRWGNLRYGPHSRMFGAENSMYDLRTQRAVVKDWRDMDDTAQRLMRQVDSMITRSAAEMNRIDLQPHGRVDDERHKAMDNLQYARLLSYESEIARALPTCNIGASHDPSSLRKGAVGSEQYRLGKRIYENTGLNIYGGISSDAGSLEEKREREDLKGSELYRLPRLRPRQFGAKLYGPNEDMTFFQTIATQIDLDELIDTESASRRMYEPHNMLDKDFQAEYARKNNLQLAD